MPVLMSLEWKGEAERPWSLYFSQEEDCVPMEVPVVVVGGGLHLASLCEGCHPLKLMMPIAASLYSNLRFHTELWLLTMVSQMSPNNTTHASSSSHHNGHQSSFHMTRYLLSTVTPSLNTLTSQLLEISKSKQDFIAHCTVTYVSLFRRELDSSDMLY